MKKIFILLMVLISLNSFSQVFSDDFNGIDSLWNHTGGDAIVYDFFNDGDSVLYIGGIVINANNLPVHGILSWNGETIKNYENNNPIQSGTYCVIKHNDTLYVGGVFHNYRDPSMNYLTYWDGESWNGFETGQPNGRVWDFRVFDDKLWVCGEFGSIGDNVCNKVAYYENGSWHSAGYFGMWSRALEIFNGELFAGGYWGVRRYLGGTDWETFAVRPNGNVNELMVDTFNTFLYVGGQFTRVGQELSGSAAMWDGFQWHALGDFNDCLVLK